MELNISPMVGPSEIFDHLYLGGIIDDYPSDFFSKIDRVISVIEEEKIPSFARPYIEKGKHLNIPINDNYNSNILYHIQSVLDFITDAVVNNERVYIHCYAGVSRSASFVIAYVMHTMEENKKFNDAMSFVLSKRENIDPNFHFCILLNYYEQWLNTDRSKSLMDFYEEKISLHRNK